MKSLPSDIENKILQLFNNSIEQQEVKDLMQELKDIPLNVSPEQLARSILTISEGDIKKIRSIFQQDFYGDPRDIIMEAERKLGNPKHYFIPPFPESELKNPSDTH